MVASMGSYGDKRSTMAVREEASPKGYVVDGGQGTVLLAKQWNS